MNGWLLLAFAIVFEVCGTSSMKLSQGFTRTLPSVAVFACYFLSLTSLTYALKHVQISVAYAIWSGVGTALITVIGALLFREPIVAMKAFSLALIIAGAIGLNFAGGSH
ncbi:MAG: multidrug efflux SMR transporter [Armatimonadetes bacterium]|nr:multidrug efflux SMR transporter [Armatimonadota bacterium]